MRSALVILLALTLLTPSRNADGADAALIEAAKKGRQGRLVHDADREPGDPSAEGGVREEISRHRAAIRARRRNARPPPRSWRKAVAGRVQADVFDGITNMIPLKRARLAGVVRACRRCSIPARAQGPGRLLERAPALRLHAGDQHHAGAEGARAADLSGPARSAMEGKDGLESELDRGRASASSATFSPAWARRAAPTILKALARPEDRQRRSVRRAPSSIRSSPASTPSG